VQAAPSLALMLPSSIIPQQNNILINPEHSDYSHAVTTISIEDFEFDTRMAKA
jgi:RES domain-containing protein